MHQTRLLLAGIAAMMLAGCASDSQTTPITVRQAPAAVRFSVEKAYPQSTVQTIDKQTYKDGTIHYEVKIKTAEGKEKEFEVAPDGQILDTH
jgi:hypothetical protein